MPFECGGIVHVPETAHFVIRSVVVTLALLEVFHVGTR
jgi:hypothetical protein